MLKNLLTWAIAHPESALLYATLILSIPGVIYAAVKTAVQKVTGRPAKGGAWTVMDVVIETLPNIPGAINRLVRAGGSPSIFAPPSTPTPLEGGQRGAVRVGALVAISGALLLAMVVGTVLSGCPNWNRPACPTPGIYSCSGDQPHYCAPTKELTPIGDEPCVLQGRVCALNAEGVARCALAPDSGVAADGGVR